MNKLQKQDLYKRTIEKWGQRAQLEMAQEEATELALAIRKLIRRNDSKRFIDLCGEIADVEIMIEQLKTMFPGIQSDIDMQKDFKLNRLEKRVLENSFNG